MSLTFFYSANYASTVRILFGHSWLVRWLSYALRMTLLTALMCNSVFVQLISESLDQYPCWTLISIIVKTFFSCRVETLSPLFNPHSTPPLMVFFVWLQEIKMWCELVLHEWPFGKQPSGDEFVVTNWGVAVVPKVARWLAMVAVWVSQSSIRESRIIDPRTICRSVSTDENHADQRIQNTVTAVGGRIQNRAAVYDRRMYRCLW